MTCLRKMTLEELERRNYAQATPRLLHPRSRILRVPFGALRIGPLPTTSASTKRICSERKLPHIL
jgi:hypothetical protein